ncbi:MAG TPA: hypothetical protein VJ570_05445 [Holophagaceae bacterium]|nr:hypothetical protein [Holophagaceae bacterium]
MARKSLFMLAILGIVAPLSATLPLVKKAQAAGFTEVKNCQSCHVDKMPKKDSHELADMGKFLMAEKTKRKAAEVDVAWLKDYKAKK